jgi:uncharacterized protein
MRRALLVGLGGVALVSGCVSSAPVHFYTLSEVPPAGAAPASSNPTAALRVTRVRIPAELDRTELVQRIDPTRLRIAEQDRWAAPLEDMIRRALSADLQARVAADTSAGPTTVSLDIEEFTVDDTCAVTLRASWKMEVQVATGTSPAAPGSQSAAQPPAGGGAGTTGSAAIQLPSSSPATCSVGALPMRMSQALAELSERILAQRG